MADAAGLRVKICGLTRREDALAADVAGADYLGVILSAGFGRSLTTREAAAVLTGTRARKVAVLVDETPTDAAAAATTIGADVVQMSGDESPEWIAELRSLGSWTIWKAVRAKSIGEIASAVERYRSVVEGFLVEGWKEGSNGGTGSRLTLDGASVRSAIPVGVDFILAGGLGPDSVADAIRAFRPDVVDVSSGVERVLRVKDHDRVYAFVEAARGATAPTSSSGAAR